MDALGSVKMRGTELLRSLLRLSNIVLSALSFAITVGGAAGRAHALQRRPNAHAAQASVAQASDLLRGYPRQLRHARDYVLDDAPSNGLRVVSSFAEGMHGLRNRPDRSFCPTVKPWPVGQRGAAQLLTQPHPCSIAGHRAA